MAINLFHKGSPGAVLVIPVGQWRPSQGILIMTIRKTCFFGFQVRAQLMLPSAAAAVFPRLQYGWRDGRILEDHRFFPVTLTGMEKKIWQLSIKTVAP